MNRRLCAGFSFPAARERGAAASLGDAKVASATPSHSPLCRRRGEWIQVCAIASQPQQPQGDDAPVQQQGREKALAAKVGGYQKKLVMLSSPSRATAIHSKRRLRVRAQIAMGTVYNTAQLN